jgi:hypothetical protein
VNEFSSDAAARAILDCRAENAAAAIAPIHQAQPAMGEVARLIWERNEKVAALMGQLRGVQAEYATKISQAEARQLAVEDAAWRARAQAEAAQKAHRIDAERQRKVQAARQAAAAEGMALEEFLASRLG